MPASVELQSTAADHLHDYRMWATTIRDPAEQTSEGIRRLQTASHSAVAEYVIATLPDGRFAMRYHVAYRCGHSSGKGSPWQPFQTRDECVDAFLTSATNHFLAHLDHTASDLQRCAQADMLKLLKGTGLFGFLEPDPIISNDDAPQILDPKESHSEAED